MVALSYTRLTEATEVEMRKRLDAAASAGEAGNSERENFERGAANGAFDLWQTLSLHHLDAMLRRPMQLTLRVYTGWSGPKKRQKNRQRRIKS
ncbi:hypothetical protein OI25_7227 [Paraburkholderia fungorum]|jgi:hypothetical protein|uniref:Resolvase/invertase-type recombinase catalytic domain-containing protein n=2 Tax=Paraburkholderia fungorum TaxID=134537 RepID=A0AAU8T9M3_9BURK|nr:hypothetical protein [Paraburkholderia fungorum]AJZ56961.1 hypothetical protein OI25_7227 [Paraburkholderia fungorum]PRZ49211.1 hypothetical protein BX589_126120 [Paraburkholderia fungorum]